ncbi:hypothetical protein BAE44_0008052 [Dichanthelium oligosanthes]|uniref:VQ domain-containing protein n=1 Tax=Dichanthelium oligosanthes TaxID=888268 RepID=A0A1E5W101_9POAL|nr:hypothetical protein BAE44_0008052 [Dichanthelium oligosanthes]
MDGVKVTYIETQFVTSDAAGFKDLVQRLTGRSPTGAGAAPAPAVAPHRPRARRAAGADDCGSSATAAAAAGPQAQGYYYHASSPAAREARVGDGRLAPPCLDETYGIGDFSDLLYGSAIQNAECGQGGSYSDYFP